MTEEAQTATETGTMTKSTRGEPARRKRCERCELCEPKSGADGLRDTVYVFARALYLRATGWSAGGVEPSRVRVVI